MAGISDKMMCIGFSGPPGAGKSTFIEAFGQLLTSHQHKVAVLTVDPSSAISGGSILGDKTRMEHLSRDPNAYIRPSPSAGTLGGVARNTSDSIVLCEGAGYNVVLIETVGVGQSETAVADMVDMFVLIMPPGAGDELQGIKRGIMELADLVLVNKADGDLAVPARRAQIELTSALKYIRPRRQGWRPDVLAVSSKDNTNIDSAWQAILQYFGHMRETGQLTENRRKQCRSWMWRHVHEMLISAIQADEDVRRQVEAVEKKVTNLSITPGMGARHLVNMFLSQIRVRPNPL
jgi:LAO/AO transport system kinase